MEDCPFQLEFDPIYEWAIPPRKRRSDVATATKSAKTIKESFEHYRASRNPEFCWSWRKANYAGWDVISPIDIFFTPLEDFEISPSASKEELQEFAAATKFTQLWNRSDSRIAVRGGDWMRAFDFKTNGGSLSMFVPNGMGTIEWILGWKATIPEGFVVLFIPHQLNGGAVEVLSGALRKKSLESMADRGVGISIAIRVESSTRVARGDVIGRFIVIPEYCLDLSENDEHRG